MELLFTALAKLALGILERLLPRFRHWLDRLPDRDLSQLSILHRAGRVLLAATVSLVCALPLIWLAMKL